MKIDGPCIDLLLFIIQKIYFYSSDLSVSKNIGFCWGCFLYNVNSMTKRSLPNQNKCILIIYSLLALLTNINNEILDFNNFLSLLSIFLFL